MFGDNQSVVTNSTLPHSQLNKRHNALCYHRVREAMACKDLLGFYHVKGENNPADILSKHWGFQQVWPQLKSLLFWAGETKDIPDEAASKKTLSANSTILRARGEYYNSHHIGSSVAHLYGRDHIAREIFFLEFPTPDSP